MRGEAPSQPIPPARIRYVGDYELQSELGRGGMGVVYKARQVSLKRSVALKLIGTGDAASEMAIRRFHVEAEAAARLKHPNIVAIHEVGAHEGHHYYSMEYVEGPSLAQLLAKGPLSPTRAATYVRKVALAVHYAHEHAVVHRDIKPANILIDGNDEPRVTDFGLAKVVDEHQGLTASGTAMGTPSYMPPEQARGQSAAVGPHSDVYSLGALLYACVTGLPPFRGRTPLDTLEKVLHTEPTAPSKVNRRVSADLDTICLRCLEKRPEHRYSSARALAEELDRLLASEPILARRPSVARRVFSWARSHPSSLAIIAAATFVGVLAFAYGLWTENRLLTWEREHPDHVRAPGELWKRYKLATGCTLATLCAVVACYWLWRKHAWARRSAGAPPSSIATYLAAALALANVSCGGWMVIAGIDATVWENANATETPSHWWFQRLALLGLVASARLLIASGQVLLEREVDVDAVLSSDQEERLLRVIRAGNREGAIQLFQRMSRSTRDDAERAVDSKADEIKRVWPQRSESASRLRTNHTQPQDSTAQEL